MKIEAEARLMLTAEAYWEYVKRLIKDLKIKQIGEGAYSQVFQHPKLKNIVVKLVLHDEEYLKFARFAMDNPKNPWLPRIAAIEPIKFDGFRLSNSSNSYLVFLEKLQPASFELQKSLIWKLVDTYELHIHASIHKWFSKSSWKKLALNSKDPGLAQFAAFAAKNFNQLDINSENVMARGRQLVFTDPIA